MADRPKRRRKVERIEDWDDARYSVVPPRAALDLQLTLVHFRVLTYLGRVNTQEGWCELSQTAVADAWQMSRQTVNAAVRDLAAWGYLEKRGQEETRSARCHYRVLIDEPDREEPDGDVSSTDDTPRDGTCRVQATPVSPLETTPVSPIKDTPLDHRSEIIPPRPPHGGARDDDEHAVRKAVDELSKGGAPRDGRRRTRADAIDEMLDRIRMVPTRERPVDLIIAPLVRQRRCSDPVPEFALGELADWIAQREVSDADAVTVVSSVLDKRRTSFKQVDVQDAVKAMAQRPDGRITISQTTDPEAAKAWLAYARANSSDVQMRRIESLLDKYGFAPVPSRLPPTDGATP